MIHYAGMVGELCLSPITSGIVRVWGLGSEEG